MGNDDLIRLPRSRSKSVDIDDQSNNIDHVQLTIAEDLMITKTIKLANHWRLIVEPRSMIELVRGFMIVVMIACIDHGDPIDDHQS